MARTVNTRTSPEPTRRQWSRDWTVVVVFALLLIAIVARLGYIQIFKANEYSELADASHKVNVTLSAKRGTIYDRNGQVLASSVEAKTIYVDPTEVTNAQKVARMLESYLGDEYELSYKDCYELVTSEDTSFVYIKRSADKDIATKLENALNKAGLSGVHFLEDTQRVYPNDEVASQVVGRVNPDGEGISGLELQYEKLMGGVDGEREVERGRSDLPIADATISETAAVDGEDIVTSIDIKLQQKCEQVLKKSLKKWKAKGASVTIMDGATGELYACCSYTKDKTQRSGYALDSGKIWSFSDVYEPGSTFKAITAVSVLTKSSVKISSHFMVPDSLKVLDKKISDSHEHSTQSMSFSQIIAESSNVGTVLASRKISARQLYNTYKKFEFGTAPATDFPGVASGKLADSDSWYPIQRANIAFGQGVLVSALQITRAFGALEQGGTMRVPHFLVDIPNDSTKLKTYKKKLGKTKKVVSKKVAKDVTQMLKLVVTDGTGIEASIKGYTVAGKTGTAEIADDSGSYKKETYLVSFAGWLERSNSDLVCLVTMDEPQSELGGGPICGPVFAKIMSYAAKIYQINPDVD